MANFKGACCELGLESVPKQDKGQFEIRVMANSILGQVKSFKLKVGKSLRFVGLES